MTRSEETLKVGGKAVQLFTGGQGPALLYLHGAGTSWWMPVHDLLGARHRVYAPVHPGFGTSEGLEEIESMEDLVFHVVDVLDALGLERVDMVGLSLGGWLAAELALRHPGRVNRLVLVDAAGTRVPGVVREDLFMASPAKARQLLFADPTSALAAELVPDVPAPERLEATLRGREAAARLLWNPHVQYRKLTSRLGRIKAPTLVVWGAEDRFAAPLYGRIFAEKIRGTRLETISDAGHLIGLERPEPYAQAVVRWGR